jgi:hypothetical protein
MRKRRTATEDLPCRYCSWPQPVAALVCVGSRARAVAAVYAANLRLGSRGQWAGVITTITWPRPLWRNTQQEEKKLTPACYTVVEITSCFHFYDPWLNTTGLKIFLFGYDCGRIGPEHEWKDGNDRSLEI